MKTFIAVVFIALSGTSVYAESRPSNSGNNLYQVLDRLDQLQIEVQQLRGTVEQQTYKIRELEKRQEAMYLDVDQRFQGSAKKDQALENAPESVSNDGVDSASVTDENQANQIPALPPAEEKFTAPVALPEKAKTINSVNVTQPVSQPPARSTYKRSVLDEQQDYQQAYETLRTGGTVQSIELFKQFLLDFPRGEYADNASYWLAEAYKLNQQPSLAKLTFQNLITYFPGSPKVPDAKLKLGFIEAELNNLDRARELLTDITRSYPGSNAANLASKKLAEINRY